MITRTRHTENSTVTERLEIGDIVQHFKKEPHPIAPKDSNEYLYRIVAFAVHSETKEPLVIYQALYGDMHTCARPQDMFLSKVDKTKYPTIEQEYRFEKCYWSEKNQAWVPIYR
jgi:hypothetical protein